MVLCGTSAAAVVLCGITDVVVPGTSVPFGCLLTSHRLCVRVSSSFSSCSYSEKRDGVAGYSGEETGEMRVSLNGWMGVIVGTGTKLGSS